MNKKKSILVFSLFFLFIFCCSFTNVDAASCSCNKGDILISVDENGNCLCESADLTACKYLMEDGQMSLAAVAEKYDAKIKKYGSNQWEVSINPKDSNDSSVLEKLRNVRFKLISINGREDNTNRSVGYNDPLIIDQELNSDGEMIVLFRVDENHLDPDCKSEYLEIELGISDGGEPKVEDVVYPDITITEPVTSLKIDCSLVNTSSPSFEQNFCKAKNAAKANDPHKSLKINYENQFIDGKKYSTLAGANSYTKFSCDATNIYSNDYIKSHGEDGYYLSDNTSYLYGSGEYTMNFGQYSYHFRPCNPISIGDVSCKIRCEEAVTVQYGAPIASKAGLCFEYKVKVTSRVTCEMTQKPQEPQKFKLCTPTPICTGIGRSGKRYYLNQGGPSEEFDECIDACDGGKYTTKCSKKCYKEVYQNSLISYKPKKNASCCTDCYTSPSTWSGDGPGRWYGGGCKSGYAAFGDGFCRHVYSNGNYCHDDCSWNGCEGNVYLNPGYAEADHTANMSKYQDAINECNAAVSCSTSTAEFTISVDYKDGSNTVKTVSFPYNTNTPGVDTVNPSTMANKNSTLLRNQGCYDSPKTSESLYLVEWGFPGSWINRKTGELSYLDKTGSAGWQFISRKFCIPFDAQDVNVNWWNYYYTKLGQNPKCPQNTVPPVEYNIHAKTKNFGYYGWNIAIDCFYGINNTEKMPCDPPDPGEPDDIKYVIRSIDLENVFPATDGESLSAATEIGRTPGFNWSLEATNNKNADYQSSPLDYAKRIQEKGYTIYSNDDQLDYKFRLTPAVLKELRQARSTDYTLYNGSNYTDDKGVIRYKSGLDILSDNTVTLKKPTAAALKCNNIIGRSSCESHTS